VTAVSRARLVVSAHGCAEEVRWQPPGTSCEVAASGDLVAVGHAPGDTRSPEIADVIYRKERPGGVQPPAWLARTLDRYPGCAVAVIPEGGGRYLVATRAGRPVSLSFTSPNEQGYNALVSAIFAYGWLCAGLPLTAFDPPRLEAAGTLRLPARTVIVPVSFTMYFGYLPPVPEPLAGPSSAIRRRISPASGASTPE
jgi:hypothetical protein